MNENNILEIKKISKCFGGIKALEDCSLEAEKGKITAIIGPNGSGKSTLFNVISGLIRPDSGEIYFKDLKIDNKEDFEIAKLGMSRTFQEVRLFKNMKVKEHLEIALNEYDEKLLRSAFMREIDNNKKINETLEFVGLSKELNNYANELSYGQRKLLDLAVTLAKKHELLMLDEPVAGINPYLRLKIKKILRNLRKSGETILIIEHDMNFVMGLADFIYVLDYGKIIASGLPKEIQKNPKVLGAYLGE